MFSKRILSCNSLLICIDGPDDMEQVIAIVKENPGKQIMLYIGEELSDEQLAEMQKKPLDPLDFRGIDNMLLTYQAVGGAVRRKSAIPPTLSRNPKAGRYGQDRRMGKSR